MITDFHAKYIADDLTRRCVSDSVEKFSAVLSGAQLFQPSERSQGPYSTSPNAGGPGRKHRTGSFVLGYWGTDRLAATT